MDNLSQDIRYRNFLTIVLTAKPCPIRIHKYKPSGSIIDQNGNVSFTLSLIDLGISRTLYDKHKKELSSRFCVNFIGEFLVRENLDQFADLLTGVDINKQSEAINSRSHVTFGLELRANRLTFEFHSSLLQQILTEDFKIQIQDVV